MKNNIKLEMKKNDKEVRILLELKHPDIKESQFCMHYTVHKLMVYERFRLCHQVYGYLRSMDYF